MTDSYCGGGIPGIVRDNLDTATATAGGSYDDIAVSHCRSPNQYQLQLDPRLSSTIPRIPLLALVLGMALGAGMAHAQGAAPPKPAPAPIVRPQGHGTDPAGQPAPQQRRRALDIRAQAPAPEVVTIRPREIPEFSRALLAPVVFQAPRLFTQVGQDRRTVVIFPGALPIVVPPTLPTPLSPRPE